MNWRNLVFVIFVLLALEMAMTLNQFGITATQIRASISNI
jgi:hypothetical protein